MNSDRIYHRQYTLTTQDQADELDAAWQEIVAGKRHRLETAAIELDAIMDRAMLGLEVIVSQIERHPESATATRLVRFLAAMYNGYDYHFDVTDLRMFDRRLQGACIDYLNYDRLAKAEVHHHLPGGDLQLQDWFEAYGVYPRITLNTEDEQPARLSVVEKLACLSRNDIIREAINIALGKQEALSFGCLVSVAERDGWNARAAGAERPVKHVRRLRDQVLRPLCGARASEWIESGFDFGSVSCEDCKHLLLQYDVQK